MEPTHVMRFDMANAHFIPALPFWTAYRKVFYYMLAAALLIVMFVKPARPTAVAIAALLIFLYNVCAKKELRHDPVELRFFDDRLVMYKPDYFLDDDLRVSETKEFLYDGFKHCRYSDSSEMLQFFGEGSFVRYQYDNKSGALINKPLKDLKTGDNIDTLWLHWVDKEAIIREIEENSPIRVQRSGSFLI